MPGASDDSPDTDIASDDYRSVSGWAIVALVLGVASAVAIGGPVLWVVPLAGIAAALVAMRKISMSHGQLVGRNVALLGLLLALLFATAGVTRTFTRRYWLEERAELVAKAFVRLLEEHEEQEAFQLTILPSTRTPIGNLAGMDAREEDSQKKKFDEFKQQPATQILEAAGDRPKAEVTSARAIGSDSENDYVSAMVRVPRTTGGGKDAQIKLVLARFPPGMTAIEQWQIVSTTVE